MEKARRTSASTKRKWCYQTLFYYETSHIKNTPQSRIYEIFIRLMALKQFMLALKRRIEWDEFISWMSANLHYLLIKRVASVLSRRRNYKRKPSMNADAERYKNFPTFDGKLASARKKCAARLFRCLCEIWAVRSDWRVVNFADIVPTQAQTVHLNFTQLPFRRHTIATWTWYSASTSSACTSYIYYIKRAGSLAA